MKEKVYTLVLIILAGMAAVVTAMNVYMFSMQVSYSSGYKEELIGGKLLLDIPDDFSTVIFAERVTADNGIELSRAGIKTDINNLLGIFPTEVCEMLDSYTLVVTDERIETVQDTLSPFEYLFKEDGETLAFVNHFTKLMVLQANKGMYRDSLYHEVGHVVDYKLGFKSWSSEWKALFEKEYDIFAENIATFYAFDENGVRWRYSPGIHSETCEEYFADVFSAYYHKHDLLKEYCPETYTFMNSIIENFDKV